MTKKEYQRKLARIEQLLEMIDSLTEEVENYEDECYPTRKMYESMEERWLKKNIKES